MKGKQNGEMQRIGKVYQRGKRERNPKGKEIARSAQDNDQVKQESQGKNRTPADDKKKH